MKFIMRISILVLIIFNFCFTSLEAQPTTPPGTVPRPKLIIGLVVDQMRWDFLYRYYDRYTANGGFKRFLNQGFSCENTLIPYTPTLTGCGHATIFTGSVPAVHGITGNVWYDNQYQETVYCTDDTLVKTVGSTGTAGEMSPRNMLVNSICDELRISNNFQSKVIGIAIKDRGSILPAGHSANAAYWYNPAVGQWITSTYYMNDLPQWVKDFNGRKLHNKYYSQNWNTLYPLKTYTQSTSDEKLYEAKPLGTDANGFPYNLQKFIDKNFAAISSTPFGNSFTTDMAIAAIEAEKLGDDNVTDFLTLSYSSPDYIGHAFGPNSIEIEDTYLRLDKDLGDFLDYLDKKVGKGQYIVFLSADHGVANTPGFLKENKIPAGIISTTTLMNRLNAQLKQKFGRDRLITSMFNYQVHLNYPVIDSAKLNKDQLKKSIMDSLIYIEGVSHVIDLRNFGNVPINTKLKDMITNGYYPQRGGDIQVVFKSNWIDGGGTGTTHGSWYSYDSHIPLLWYGWNIPVGKTNRETYMTDIAPTIAALLKIQMPGGTVGRVITEVVK